MGCDGLYLSILADVIQTEGVRVVVLVGRSTVRVACWGRGGSGEEEGIPPPAAGLIDCSCSGST